MTPIPENVSKFLGRAEDDVGKLEAMTFGQRMHCEIVEREIESPIEQLFFIAINVMARSIHLPVDPCPGLDPANIAHGLYVSPQSKVDQYRVDFLLTFEPDWPTAPGAPRSRVVIELDGHDFHDRDKRQRSYEKARDRHLLRRGYKVLHFTGSDVVKDPYAVAHEVLDTLGVCLGGLEPYSVDNPIGIY